MTYVSKPSRLAELALKLTASDKRSERRTALKAANPPTPPAPKFPTGAPPPPTSPDAPFGSDSAAVARFIVACNERRLKGCPPVTPTNEAAEFIVGTVAKLRARI